MTTIINIVQTVLIEWYIYLQNHYSFSDYQAVLVGDPTNWASVTDKVLKMIIDISKVNTHAWNKTLQKALGELDRWKC